LTTEALWWRLFKKKGHKPFVDKDLWLLMSLRGTVSGLLNELVLSGGVVS
jgi:hypothetical protein